MERKKKNQVSVRFDNKEPIKVSDQKFTKKLNNVFSRYEKIEEVAGRPIEEILLENLQMKNRRNDLGHQIKEFNETFLKVKNVLLQLLDVELTLNPDISRAVADEFEVNKYNEYAQGNLDSIEVLAEALRKMRYYYHPSTHEWVETVKKSEQLAYFYEDKSNQLEEELQSVKEELKEVLQKQKNANRELQGKGIQILVNKQAQTSKIEKTEVEAEVEQLESEEVVLSKVKEPVTVGAASQEESEEKVYVTSTYKMVKPKKKINVEKEQEGFEQKNTELAYYDAPETEMVEEIQKTKYMMLLDKKGYDYTKSEHPQFDIMIKKPTDNIPLIYIDYLIQQAEVFDEIMKKTDQIYLLFDTKENMKKGNAKFTSWLLKSKEKRKVVKFSFTTMDELKVSGLDELESL